MIGEHDFSSKWSFHSTNIYSKIFVFPYCKHFFRAFDKFLHKLFRDILLYPCREFSQEARPLCLNALPFSTQKFLVIFRSLCSVWGNLTAIFPIYHFLHHFVGSFHATHNISWFYDPRCHCIWHITSLSWVIKCLFCSIKNVTTKEVH